MSFAVGITTFGWIVIGMAVLAVFLIVGMIWSERRKRRGFGKGDRGTEPGQGGIVLHAGWPEGSESGSRTRVWIVPQDPQSYAKGFVPRGRK